jgi:hypothetical protein
MIGLIISFIAGGIVGAIAMGLMAATKERDNV